MGKVLVAYKQGDGIPDSAVFFEREKRLESLETKSTHNPNRIIEIHSYIFYNWCWVSIEDFNGNEVFTR